MALLFGGRKAALVAFAEPFVTRDGDFAIEKIPQGRRAEAGEERENSPETSEVVENHQDGLGPLQNFTVSPVDDGIQFFSQGFGNFLGGGGALQRSKFHLIRRVIA